MLFNVLFFASPFARFIQRKVVIKSQEFAVF